MIQEKCSSDNVTRALSQLKQKATTVETESIENLWVIKKDLHLLVYHPTYQPSNKTAHLQSEQTKKVSI